MICVGVPCRYAGGKERGGIIGSLARVGEATRAIGIIDIVPAVLGQEHTGGWCPLAIGPECQLDVAVFQSAGISHIDAHGIAGGKGRLGIVAAP